MTEETQSIYLTANFGEYGGVHSWKTFAEIRDWIAARRTDWQWLSQQRHNPTDSAWSFINDTLNQCQQNLNNAEQHKGNPQQEDAFKRSAVQQLESVFKNFHWLLPDNPYVEFVFKMRDSGRALEAGLVVAYLLNRDLNNGPISAALRGIVEFELFSRGIKDRARTEAASLRKLSGEMTTKLDELKQLQVLQGTEFETLNRRVEDQISDQNSNFNDAQAARDAQWQQKLADSEAELKRLNETPDFDFEIVDVLILVEDDRGTSNCRVS